MGGAVDHPVVPLSLSMVQLFGIGPDISMAFRNLSRPVPAPDVFGGQFFLNCGLAQRGLGHFVYWQD
jgi:hypothetical protein